VAWDSSRPVAYRRLFKEWLIYAAIMTVLFLVVMRDEANEVSLLFGLLASLPLYIGFSYVLAKFGYQRKTLADLRTPRATSAAATSSDASTPDRQRPAPTRRTASSASRRGQRPPSRKRR
jgi:hypothetical protein